ncbi:MAG: hypothetical protein KA297_17325 [Kofleriaceae bacterium]|jgi:hypothetical protein|nr:hypothetical protein [Kofleriaceae bacterium]MBP6839463.1 hypothetical protein [Kofleriaceae bacterium]
MDMARLSNSPILTVLPALAVTVASSLATVACVDDGEQAAPTAAEVAACPSTTFRIGEVRLPQRSTEVATSGFDLDGARGGDTSTDNQLGGAYAMFSTMSGLDLGAGPNQRLATSVRWAVRVHECADLGVRGVTLVDLDRAPAEVDPADLAVGAIVAGTATMTAGAGAVPLATLGDAMEAQADAGWLPAGDLTVRIGAIDGSTIEAAIGLAVDPAAAQVALAAPVAAVFNAAPPARVALYTESLDDDGDGVISAAEVQTSPTYAALLAPDLEDTAGAPRLSAGFIVRATR